MKEHKMKTIWIYTYAVLIVIKSIPSLRRAKKMDHTPYEKKAWAIYQTPRDICRKVIKQTRSDVTVKGIEHVPEGPVLFVANHQGLFDILLLLGFIERPMGFIAKKEIKKIPLVSSWMEQMNCVFIDRTNKRTALKVIEDGVMSIKSGQSMVVFPEGTRSRGGAIQPFKSGSLRLGIRAGVPIVPVLLEGTHDVLESNDGKVRSASMSLTVCPPIFEKDYETLKPNALAEQIYQEIKSRASEKYQ